MSTSLTFTDGRLTFQDRFHGIFGKRMSFEDTPFTNGRIYFSRVDPTQAEDWQVIWPVRTGRHGVEALNGLVQRTLSRDWLEDAAKEVFAARSTRPKAITASSTATRLSACRTREVDESDAAYVANGDLGLAVGAYKSAKQKNIDKQLGVRFTLQPGCKYSYKQPAIGP